MTEADTSSDNPGVIAFPPLIWLVGAVSSALVHFFVIQLPIMRYRICLVCGIVVLILAPALALSALVTMKTARTNVDPAKPALTIVRGGPFRFTRNPMYLALCLLQVALGFFSERLDHAVVRRPPRPDPALRGDPARREISHR